MSNNDPVKEKESQQMTELNYKQRKALRRLGRGQTINYSMYSDPIIRNCIDRSDFPQKPDLNAKEYPYNMFDDCDWIEKMMSYRPKLSSYGRKLLKELDEEEKDK